MGELVTWDIGDTVESSGTKHGTWGMGRGVKHMGELVTWDIGDTGEQRNKTWDMGDGERSETRNVGELVPWDIGDTWGEEWNKTWDMGDGKRSETHGRAGNMGHRGHWIAAEQNMGHGGWGEE